MSSKRTSCHNDPNVFCYMCGDHMVKEHRFNVRELTRKAYQAYFGGKLGDQDKSWAPHKVWKNCTDTLRLWTQGKVKSMKFGVTMVWQEPRNHHDDCYFCMVNTSEWNRHKKKSWYYPDIESAKRPVPHCSDLPLPGFTSLPDLDPNDDTISIAEDIKGFDAVTAVAIFKIFRLQNYFSHKDS